MILDLGSGLRPLGDRLAIRFARSGEPPKVNVLLTHLHYDHIIGLPFYGLHQDPDGHMVIYGPAGHDEGPGLTLPRAVHPPYFPVTLDEFPDQTTIHDLPVPSVFSLGGYRVMVQAVAHAGFTVGYRLEINGSSLAYLSDHQAPLDGVSVEPSVMELCRDVDLLVHDAQYTPAEFGERSDWGHSTPDYAVRVALSAGVKRLHLFHHDPAHSDGQLDEILAGAQALSRSLGGPPVEAAREGESHRIGEG